jgi:hypothetical protein
MMDTDLVQADAILRIANVLEALQPVIEKLGDNMAEFTKVQAQAYNLMRAREEEIEKAMRAAEPIIRQF